MEEWFSAYQRSPEQKYVDAPAAFRAIGTNALPLLVDRLNRDITLSRLERWIQSLPRRFRPKLKTEEAYTPIHAKP